MFFLSLLLLIFCSIQYAVMHEPTNHLPPCYFFQQYSTTCWVFQILWWALSASCSHLISWNVSWWCID